MPYYSLGPWVAQTIPRPARVLPLGATGAIDLSSQATDVGLFVSFLPLVSVEHTLLNLNGEDLRTHQVNARIRNAVRDATGYTSPVTGTLAELLLDVLENGDPAGTDRWYPIMPTTGPALSVHVPGHGEVLREVFVWGQRGSTNAIQARIRADIHRQVQRIQTEPQRTHVRRVLGGLVRKYGGVDWTEFVAPEDRGEVGGPLSPRTTHTDDFNRTESADGSIASGAGGASWLQIEGNDWSLDGDELVTLQEGFDGAIRLDADVSSDDHYAEQVVVSLGAGAGSLGTIVRAETLPFQGNQTYYYYYHGGDIYKQVNGAHTQLTTVTAQTTGTFRLEVNGSGLTAKHNGSSQGSTTDTAITGFMRGGIYAYDKIGNIDSFTIADLVAATHAHGVIGQAFLFSKLQGLVR